MSTPNIPIAPTRFINVLVTALPNIDADGKVSYITTFSPEAILVSDSDTVINYQLIAPTPADVIFKGMTVVEAHAGQFSEPSISQSGKLLTFSDANTSDETIHVFLKFTDKDKFEFGVDPEVINNPKPN